MNIRVLVVEDDPRVSRFLERGLRAEGLRVEVVERGREALAWVRAQPRARPGSGLAAESVVMVLDLNLPDLSGLEVCQTLRQEGYRLPILMLTAQDRLEDRVRGLRTGADDYLGKPFAFDEVLARIEALARRVTPAEGSTAVTRVMQVGSLRLDLDQMRATRAGLALSLTSKELALLELLMSSPGRLFSRERILSAVWGLHEDPLTNVVDVYIRRLRKKVDREGEPSLIQTERGLGYRLEER